MTENYYKQYEPIFGVWRITRLIGEGFQSKVFEMEREDFGVTYKAALKAITIPAGEKQVREVMDEGMDEKGVYQYFYTMVKDHRTGFETGNVNAVMDGDLDGFINAYLKALAHGELKE